MIAAPSDQTVTADNGVSSSLEVTAESEDDEIAAKLRTNTMGYNSDKSNDHNGTTKLSIEDTKESSDPAATG